ncbi:MAG: NAD(P) transhydrogenase subunit alpha, partial [Planctomycetes bacterium]|nr:NAD(P) transhydrogenase subunit alpha [Planctomycetota bacterium]
FSSAVAGISLVGAMLAAGQSSHFVLRILGGFAVVGALINVAGGFLVTKQFLDESKTDSDVETDSETDSEFNSETPSN